MCRVQEYSSCLSGPRETGLMAGPTVVDLADFPSHSLNVLRFTTIMVAVKPMLPQPNRYHVNICGFEALIVGCQSMLLREWLALVSCNNRLTYELVIRATVQPNLVHPLSSGQGVTNAGPTA